mgnify:CR=1 FL=1
MSVRRMLWVRQIQEQLDEASYVGNIGVMELVKFYSKASPKDKSMLQSLIKRKKNEEAWKLVQDVTGVKLHKSVVGEEVKPDILPKAGAGQWGTYELANTYKNATPGQKITKRSEEHTSELQSH